MWSKLNRMLVVLRVHARTARPDMSNFAGRVRAEPAVLAARLP